MGLLGVTVPFLCAAVAASSARADGNGSFKINGLTIAQSEAKAYAEAFAEGTVEAAACNKCSAAAEFIASSWSELFLNAVARAETKLEGAANGGSVKAATTTFVEAVTEATVVAFSSVLVRASASVDDGCNVTLLTNTRTGDERNPDETFCDINVAGVTETVSKNAVVSAVFEARAEACDSRSEISGSIVAQELAVATAEAISIVLADCEVVGTGFACALGETDVRATARATATSFARGFAEAVSTCDPPRCTISVEVIAENTEEVLVKAASEALASQCTGSDDFFSIVEVQEDISTATIDALAEVIIKALVEGDDCLIGLGVASDTIPKCDGLACAGKNKKCGGKGFAEVLPCCNDDFLCVKKNNGFMQCRRDGIPRDDTWDGTVVTCGKQ